MNEPANHAWAGTFGELCSRPRLELLSRLERFIPDATSEQREAWRAELDVLEREGAQVISLHPPAAQDGALLEYMLPREAGRRPDVLVLQNGTVVVVEFKSSGRARHSDLDQVRAYARDLAQYHSGCDGQQLIPVLVLCGAGAEEQFAEGVRVIPAHRLGAALLDIGRLGRGPAVDVKDFVAGEYAPLPSLVAAARLLFNNLPLPAVRRASSAGVHAAVERVLTLAREARDSGTRKLVLLTGVPGAGKTLVGLQVAHSAALEQGYRMGERTRRGAPATFLSGNGPLVQVLQHALKSTVFVQDMHRYIREHGLERPDRQVREYVIVFDEAQRAWDREKLGDFYARKLPHTQADLGRSEPDLLIEIADRGQQWSLVLALVGEGQEIHTGEEAGLGQWGDAVRRSSQPWQVHGPLRLAQAFSGLPFTPERAMDLNTSLRAQAAGQLHRWVSHLLDHCDLDQAARVATRGCQEFGVRARAAG